SDQARGLMNRALGPPVAPAAGPPPDAGQRDVHRPDVSRPLPPVPGPPPNHPSVFPGAPDLTGGAATHPSLRGEPGGPRHPDGFDTDGFDWRRAEADLGDVVPPAFVDGGDGAAAAPV